MNVSVVCGGVKLLWPQLKATDRDIVEEFSFPILYCIVVVVFFWSQRSSRFPLSKFPMQLVAHSFAIKLAWQPRQFYHI